MIFEHKKHKEYILKTFEAPNLQNKFFNNLIRLLYPFAWKRNPPFYNRKKESFRLSSAQADEPSDIYFENQNINWLTSIKLAIIANIVTILVMGICSGLIIGIKLYPSFVPVTGNARSIVVSLVISLANSMISVAIQTMSR